MSLIEKLLEKEVNNTKIIPDPIIIIGKKSPNLSTSLLWIYNNIGKKINHFTIIGYAGTEFKYKQRRHLVFVQCICGKFRCLPAVRIRASEYKSCGCQQNTVEKCGKAGEKGRKKEPKIASAYVVWKSHYIGEGLLFEDFLILSQLPCHYCGQQPSNIANSLKRWSKHYSPKREATRSIVISDGDFIYNGLDRLDNSKGHSPDNVVPCCRHCNYAKRDRGVNEFILWVKQIYDHLDLEKTDQYKKDNNE